MTLRCEDYWLLYLAWCDEEKCNGNRAKEKLLKLQEHLQCCHQCRLWWIEEMENLKSGGKHE